MLVKLQRNQLLEVIQNTGLSPNNFEENTQANKYIISCRSGGLSYYFSLKEPAATTRAKFWIECSPGTSEDEHKHSGWAETWQSALLLFTFWAAVLNKELDAPDLWAEAAKTAQLFAPTAEPSDDKFTRIELAEVQGQLRLLQLSLTHAALPEAAKRKLIELTETAAVKAEGLTKKDWQNWIIGGFIGAITNLALNPAQAGEVLKLVKAAFGGLFLH